MFEFIKWWWLRRSKAFRVVILSILILTLAFGITLSGMLILILSQWIAKTFGTTFVILLIISLIVGTILVSMVKDAFAYKAMKQEKVISKLKGEA